MFQTIRRHINSTTIVAVVALVFAMTGGAYAAKRILITSTSQISKPVLAKLKGANGKNGTNGAAGPAGPAGPTGPVGPAGPTGPAGTPGSAGQQGEKGADGAPGSEGPEGQPWTPNSVLPSNAVETGTWLAPANASSAEFGTISFPIQLASELDVTHVKYVTVKDVDLSTIPSGCAGTAAKPAAEAGFLCVFEGKVESAVGTAEGQLILKSTENVPGAGVTGAVILIESEGTESRFSGTWAVRGA